MADTKIWGYCVDCKSITTIVVPAIMAESFHESEISGRCFSHLRAFREEQEWLWEHGYEIT